jgi:hypothetical protein
MKRTTAERIVDMIRDEISSLHCEGYEDQAFDGTMDDRWVDAVLKIAAEESKGEIGERKDAR